MSSTRDYHALNPRQARIRQHARTSKPTKLEGKRRGSGNSFPDLPFPIASDVQRSVGSSLSRSQSPSIETDSVVNTMMLAGESRIHGARVRYSRP